MAYVEPRCEKCCFAEESFRLLYCCIKKTNVRADEGCHQFTEKYVHEERDYDLIDD